MNIMQQKEQKKTSRKAFMYEMKTFEQYIPTFKENNCKSEWR